MSACNIMKLYRITCGSTFKAVDVSVPLCQICQMNWQVVMCQLHHISYEKEAGRTWEGRSRCAGKELIEILQQPGFSGWMKELRKTKVKQRASIRSSLVVYMCRKKCANHYIFITLKYLNN